MFIVWCLKNRFFRYEWEGFNLCFLSKFSDVDGVNIIKNNLSFRMKDYVF